jgi:hypothetical protein
MDYCFSCLFVSSLRSYRITVFTREIGKHNHWSIESGDPDDVHGGCVGHGLVGNVCVWDVYGCLDDEGAEVLVGFGGTPLHVDPIPD